MKAAYIEETGPPENIIYGDLPKPKVSGTQVLVKVRAVAVNPVDTYIRNGANYWELPQPYIVGCDLAGVVEKVGPDVTRFEPGDRVWGTNQGLMGRQGTFAQFCAVDECWLYKTPSEVEDETVAASALVGVTAHLGLFRDAKIKAGEIVFVNGGSGGVGSMVVQMARCAGARVIATAGNDKKVEACKTLGAELAINYKTDPIEEAVVRFAPGGVDVYWETAREPNFDRIVSYMAERGRIILMAGREARPPFPVGPFYVKGCSMHGFAMFKATADELRACAGDMNRWFAAGMLKPNVSLVMPLSEAAAAHRLQEENTLGRKQSLAGKIVLKT